MGLQSFSSNSFGGSGIISLLVSIAPCVIRKSAISWYACSKTCRINEAFGLKLDLNPAVISNVAMRKEVPPLLCANRYPPLSVRCSESHLQV